MSFDCPTEVHLRCYVQFHAVGSGVEDADVVSVIVGVLGVLAALIVNSGGGAVEEVLWPFLALGRLCITVDAGVRLDRKGWGERDAVGCCCRVSAQLTIRMGKLKPDVPRIGGKSLEGALITAISAESRFLFLWEDIVVEVEVDVDVEVEEVQNGGCWRKKREPMSMQLSRTRDVSPRL